MSIQLHPIGTVSNGHDQKPPGGWSGVISQATIRRKYETALSGLEDFSHIMVLFWLHRVARHDRTRALVHPMGKQHLPLVGVFSTHSPVRPNPIAVTVCELIQREGTVLTVRGLDALDGTPILDIKSFSSGGVPGTTRQPAWMDEVLNSSRDSRDD